MVKKSALWKIFFLMLLVGGISFVSSMANPAAVYCEEMKNLFDDYSFEIRMDSIGNQYGVCLTPDGKTLDEWKFFNGIEGKEYSYCAQIGYETLEGEFGANCVLSSRFKSFSNNLEMDSLSTPSDSIVSVIELMNLKEKWGGLDLQEEDSAKNSEQVFSKNSLESERLSSPLSSEQNFAGSSLPDYWDWRSPPNSSIYGSANYSYFDNNHGWMTPVKNQGDCGSCWAFSAMGAIESKYEISNLNSKLNPSLSEQNVLSCSSGDCSGGHLDTTFDWIKSNGVVDNICYPYVASKTSCNNTICSDFSQRKFNVTYTELISFPFSLSTEQLKTHLINYGPLSIGIVGVSGISNNYWSCTEGSGHAVVLVGYNDSGQYWITKNSWGITSGESGYVKLRYNECGIGKYVYGVNSVTSSNYGPILNMTLYPENDSYLNFYDKTNFSFNFFSRINNNASFEILFNNRAVNSSAYVTNGSDINFLQGYDNSYGNEINWIIKAWEEGVGAISSFAGNFLTYYFNSSIVFNSPQNNLYYNNKTILVNLSYSENVSMVIYGNGTLNLTYIEPEYFDFIDGNNTLYVYVNDSYGNNGTQNISFFIDSIPPQINYSTAGNYSRYSNVTFNSNMSDNFLLKNISLETNISGELLNYSKNISGIQNTSEFNLNISSPEIWNFSYRFHATDLAGNIDSTDWTTIEIENSASVFNVSYSSRSFFVNTNYSLNKSLLFSDVDPQLLSIGVNDSLNLNVWENESEIIISAINESVRSGWLYIMVNDSINVSYVNVSVMIRTPDWVDLGTFSVSDGTTNISALSYFLNVPINLSNSSYGVISFSSVSLMQEEFNLSNKIFLSRNRVEINSSALPEFNVPATISMYNVTFTNATIHKNGNATACFDCSLVSHNHSSGVFVFSVTGFSYYEITEATYYDGVQNCYDGKCEGGIDCGGSSPIGCGYVAPSTTSSGGGGGGGGSAKIIPKNYSLILANDGDASNFSMGINDSVLVYVDNTLHIFNLKNVSNSSILFSLDNIHFFKININETYGTNLNSNNVNEVKIYYQNYSNKKANVYFAYNKTTLFENSPLDKTDSVFGIYELTFSSYLDYIKNFVLENTFPLVICILLMAIVYFSIFLILENRRLERHLQKRRF